MKTLVLGETIIDVNYFLKNKEISSHSKKNKYIFNNKNYSSGGASNITKYLKKNFFFFSNKGLFKSKYYFNISNTQIFKHRYWYKNQLIFQINSISDKKKIYFDKNYISQVSKYLNFVNVLVLSNYNYGLFDNTSNIDRLIKNAISKKIKIYYDSQIRNLAIKYIPKKTDYFLMNRKEFQLYLKYFKIGKKKIVDQAYLLKKKIETKNLIIKRDKDGCICISEKNKIFYIRTTKKIKNSIGTGDKFLAGLIMQNNNQDIEKKLIFSNKFAIS